MAHPFHHAESSARKYGGRPEDYQAIHNWFDASKAHLAQPRIGPCVIIPWVFEAEQRFGMTLRNSDGRVIPVRWIGEQHVREDCNRIPSPQDWLRHLPIEHWMVHCTDLPDHLAVPDHPEEAWRKAVANAQTTLGLTDWMASCQIGDFVAK